MVDPLHVGTHQPRLGGAAGVGGIEMDAGGVDLPGRRRLASGQQRTRQIGETADHQGSKHEDGAGGHGIGLGRCTSLIRRIKRSNATLLIR